MGKQSALTLATAQWLTFTSTIHYQYTCLLWRSDECKTGVKWKHISIFHTPNSTPGKCKTRTIGETLPPIIFSARRTGETLEDGAGRDLSG